jgi:hypothetical protein
LAATDDSVQALADAINNLAAAIREITRQTPARGLNTNIRSQDTYTGRTRRAGFQTVYAEHQEEQ